MKKVLTFVFAGALLVASASAAEEGVPAKGKATFEEKCSACHEIATAEQKMGPSLKGLFKKAKMQNGAKPSDATVLKVINEGGNGMPPYSEDPDMTEARKNDVIAFLKTL